MGKWKEIKNQRRRGMKDLIKWKLFWERWGFLSSAGDERCGFTERVFVSVHTLGHALHFRRHSDYWRGVWWYDIYILNWSSHPQRFAVSVALECTPIAQSVILPHNSKDPVRRRSTGRGNKMSWRSTAGFLGLLRPQHIEDSRGRTWERDEFRGRKREVCLWWGVALRLWVKLQSGCCSLKGNQKVGTVLRKHKR